MKCGEFEKRNKEFLKSFDIDTYFKSLVLRRSSDNNIVIFDVGAHKGESAIFFHNLFPNAKIFSFEPNTHAAKEISSLNLNNVAVFDIALSDSSGTKEFYVQDLSHLSSLNKVNSSSKASLGYAKRETHVVQLVTVKRGDEFCIEHDINHIDLLKIDVQANEVHTLAGFKSIIPNIEVIFVEACFYDFYSTRSSILKIEQLLPNFELYDIYEISKNPKTLGTDWATLVYARKR